MDDRDPAEAPADPQMDRVHGDPFVRHGNPALRGTTVGEPGEPRPRFRHVVVEPTRLPVGVPLRELQRGRSDRRRPARDRARGCGAHRHSHRVVQAGGLMRVLARTTRIAILTLFAIFFVVPLVWLVLAPTKTDAQIGGGGWWRFGSFHQIALAWRHLDAFSDHIFRKW